eukprot:10764693-Ditylum_brightwellii.AAC.1
MKLQRETTSNYNIKLRHETSSHYKHPETTTHTTTTPFDLGDLVYTKHHVNGGYHQDRIEMVINNGMQYLVSWVNQNRSDMLVPRCHVMGYIIHHAFRHERATSNHNGGQDETDKAAGQSSLDLD